MNREEKILMVQCLLHDVRLDFSDQVNRRVELAINLCNELGDDFLILVGECKDFLEDEFTDGRYFRDDFPYGYLGMEELHGLTNTYQNRSSEFKQLFNNYINCPEYIFSDWKESG